MNDIQNTRDLFNLIYNDKAFLASFLLIFTGAGYVLWTVPWKFQKMSTEFKNFSKKTGLAILVAGIIVLLLRLIMGLPLNVELGFGNPVINFLREYGINSRANRRIIALVLLIPLLIIFRKQKKINGWMIIYMIFFILFIFCAYIFLWR